MVAKKITHVFNCLLAACFLVLGATLAFSLASGCQSLELLPSEEVALEAAVKSGTLLFIDKYPDSANAAIDASRSVYEAIESGEVDLVKLRQIAESAVDFNDLSQEQSLMLDQMLDLIGQQIEAEEIDSEKIVKLSKVLLWINEAYLLSKTNLPE